MHENSREDGDGEQLTNTRQACHKWSHKSAHSPSLSHRWHTMSLSLIVTLPWWWICMCLVTQSLSPILVGVNISIPLTCLFGLLWFFPLNSFSISLPSSSPDHHVKPSNLWRAKLSRAQNSRARICRLECIALGYDWFCMFEMRTRRETRLLARDVTILKNMKMINGARLLCVCLNRSLINSREYSFVLPIINSSFSLSLSISSIFFFEIIEK